MLEMSKEHLMLHPPETDSNPYGPSRVFIAYSNNHIEPSI